MSETFEQQVIRIWMSAEARDYDEKVDPTEFARALAAEWFREPIGWMLPAHLATGQYMHVTTKFSLGAEKPVIAVGWIPLYRKPEGL